MQCNTMYQFSCHRSKALNRYSHTPQTFFLLGPSPMLKNIHRSRREDAHFSRKKCARGNMAEGVFPLFFQILAPRQRFLFFCDLVVGTCECKKDSRHTQSIYTCGRQGNRDGGRTFRAFFVSFGLIRVDSVFSE